MSQGIAQSGLSDRSAPCFHRRSVISKPGPLGPTLGGVEQSGEADGPLCGDDFDGQIGERLGDAGDAVGQRRVSVTDDGDPARLLLSPPHLIDDELKERGHADAVLDGGVNHLVDQAADRHHAGPSPFSSGLVVTKKPRCGTDLISWVSRRSR